MVTSLPPVPRRAPGEIPPASPARAHTGFDPGDRTRWLPWLRWWASLLDSRYRVPGTNIRFGLDPLFSLVPGLGELATPVFTAALLAQVFRQRVPRMIVLRMLTNSLVDVVLGAIPIAGTIGDVFFRANLRNLALLERHADPGRHAGRGDYVFVIGVAIAFAFVIAIPVVAAVWLAVTLGRAL